MSRVRTATAGTAFLGLAALGLCAPASADVLEIGSGGATWIAGSPHRRAPGLVENQQTANQGLTQIADSAGPAPWRANVAALAVKYNIGPALLEAVFGGDVERALAAYNAGPGRVARAGGVPAIRETQVYVASIMARLANPVRR